MTSSPPAPWHDGWHESARALPSPNFNARPAGTEVSLLVVHSISLPPGQYGTGEVQNLFTNHLRWDAHPYFAQIRGLQVSSHFFIERSGQLWQFVSCDARAWHAGRSMHRGRPNCNDYSIGIELEGLEGQPFNAPQYAQLARLCDEVAHVYSIAHITGHEHIAPGRKQDPGPGFDWQRLRQLLQWPEHRFTLEPQH